MRHFYRFIIFSTFLFSSSTYALEFFFDALDWRVTETNDWAYVNNEMLPDQTLHYKTIDFHYTPGFRIGLSYHCNCFWDALFSYTRFYTTTHDATIGNIQPAFLGSVTAKPSHAYLYQSGQVSQAINYNIFDLDFGKKFNPIPSLTVHPIVGLMGGWINQSIHANYQGSTSSREKIVNNFSGLGPKVGVDVGLCLFDVNNFQPEFVAAFAAAYLLSHWSVDDVTHVNTGNIIYVNGVSHSMGALTLQGAMGIKAHYKKFALKLLYEINDWFNQNQFFDNDTGAHNNDLVLQGVTLGLSYDL